MRIYRILKMVLGSVLLVNAAFAATGDSNDPWHAKYSGPVTAHRLSRFIEGAPIAPEELTYGVVMDLVVPHAAIRGHTVHWLSRLTMQGISEILKHSLGLKAFVPFEGWIPLTAEGKKLLPFLPDAIVSDMDCVVQLAYFFPSAFGLSGAPVALIIHYNKACGAPSIAEGKSLLGADGLLSYQEDLDRLDKRFENMISVLKSSAPIEGLRFYGDLGYEKAQYNLALCYLEGNGVVQNDAQAAGWFRRAADAGDVKAQYNLGMMYKQGKGVPKDYANAAGWFRRAAEAGYNKAQYNLGVCYREGKGVDQKDAQAAEWFHRAAEAGYNKAQYHLGKMYKEGKGVGQDYNLALEWLRKAFGNGVSEAQDEIDSVQALKAPAA